MKLVLIFGAGAVGKMTVGQELSKLTGLRLFHNHMSIEPVLEVFGERNNDVVNGFRELVFKNYAKTDKYGLIFTFIWDFSSKNDWKYVKHLQKIFKKSDIYYVELVADQQIRLKRNTTENRLQNKPSKRDIEKSNSRILKEDKNQRTQSYDGEIKFENYIKIDNSELEPDVVAKMIQEKFKL